MAIVQRNIQIKSSPQETMALLRAASRWPDWYPGMTEIDRGLGGATPDDGINGKRMCTWRSST
jgi:hypothetical protein